MFTKENFKSLSGKRLRLLAILIASALALSGGMLLVSSASNKAMADNSAAITPKSVSVDIQMVGQSGGADASLEKVAYNEGENLVLKWKGGKYGNDFIVPSTITFSGSQTTINVNELIKVDAVQTANVQYERRMGTAGTMTTYENVENYLAKTHTLSLGTAYLGGTVTVTFVKVSPVYRLYNMITSEHLFTTNKGEYDDFVELCKIDQDAWIGEGIDWLAPASGDSAKQVYRLYNQGLGAMGRSSHYYTADLEEKTRLETENGWVDDGTENGFLSGGTTPIYTCYNEDLGSAHHYTASRTEWSGLENHGWALEKDKNGVDPAKNPEGVFQCDLATSWSFNGSYYTVRHLLDGVLEDTQDISGEIGDVSKTATRNYVGYTAETPTLKKDENGQSYVEINYVPNTYTITYDMNEHGAQIESTKAAYGSKITAPVAPTEDGYVFGGWYYDAACTAGNEVSWTTMPATDMVVCAKWTKEEAKEDPKTETKDVSGLSVSLDTTPVYTGTEVTQNVIVKDGEKTLTEGVDYKVEGNTATVAGEDYELTITGMGDYSGTLKKTWKVEQATPKAPATIPTVEAIAGQSLSELTLPTVEGGTLSWKDSTLSVGTATGEQEFEAVFTPDDTDNYTTLDVKVKVNVNPEPVTTNASGEVTVENKSGDSVTVIVKDTGDQPIEGASVSLYDNGDVVVKLPEGVDKDLKIKVECEAENVNVTAQTSTGDDRGTGVIDDMGDVTLKKITVKFEIEGATVEDKTTYTGRTVEQPETPVRDGYVFKDWYTNSTKSEKFNFESALTEGTTVYGDWKTNLSKELFTIDSTTGYTYTGTAIEPKVTSATLKDGDYKVTYSDNTNVGKGKIKIEGQGDYAGTFELEFDITKATPTTPENISTVEALANQSLSELTLPEVAGGSLAWKDDSATVGTNLGEQQFIAVFTPADTDNYTTAEVNVKVNVASDQFTITYAGVDGATNTNSTTYKFKTGIDKLEAASKTGYTFAGWKNDKDETVTEIPATAKENMTLTATWTVDNYTITYHNVDNATNPNASVTSYTIESETITLQNATKTDNYFAGWFENEGLTGDPVTQIAKGSTGNKDLYASWYATKVKSGSDGKLKIYDEKTGKFVNVTVEDADKQDSAGIEGATVEVKDGVYTVTLPDHAHTLDVKVTLTETDTPSKTVDGVTVNLHDYNDNQRGTGVTENGVVTFESKTGTTGENGKATIVDPNGNSLTVEVKGTDGNAIKDATVWVDSQDDVQVKLPSGTDCDLSVKVTDSNGAGKSVQVSAVNSNDEDRGTVKSGGNGEATLKKLTVSFKLDHATVAGKTTYTGRTVVKPDTPTASGYTFEDWYTSEAKTEKFSFDTTLTEDKTLYGKWRTNLTNSMFTGPSEAVVYNGSELKPGITTELSSDQYKITYSNNTNVGTGKITIEGLGDYAGTVELEFTISPATLSPTAEETAKLAITAESGKKLTDLVSSLPTTYGGQAGTWKFTKDSSKAALTDSATLGSTSPATYYATFTPTSGNYQASEDVAVTITVTSAADKYAQYNGSFWLASKAIEVDYGSIDEETCKTMVDEYNMDNMEIGSQEEVYEEILNGTVLDSVAVYKSASEILADRDKIAEELADGYDESVDRTAHLYKIFMQQETAMESASCVRLFTPYDDTNSAYKDGYSNYAEFRIINVGSYQYDTSKKLYDGSTLTFQATHILPEYIHGAEGSGKTWVDSYVRSQLKEGGTIYSKFNSGLISCIKTVKKLYNTDMMDNWETFCPGSKYAEIEDKLFVLSTEEMGAFGIVQSDPYEYWSTCVKWQGSYYSIQNNVTSEQFVVNYSRLPEGFYGLMGASFTRTKFSSSQWCYVYSLSQYNYYAGKTLTWIHRDPVGASLDGKSIGIQPAFCL